ncbi:YihY/virulence factor BrkB family protein, partial [Streptomyces daliensis]|nr:YihY/virulence factor BrkB family protein [Streptomyces daliensis]
HPPLKPAPGAYRAALRRTPASIWNDDVSDWAAALTYYAILALLPALLVTVTLIGLASPAATQDLIDQIVSLAPADAGHALRGALEDMAHERSAFWLLAGAGTVSALWSASSYLAVFRRALHGMHRVKDSRPALRKAHFIVLTALALLALLVTSAVVLVVSGPLARTLGGWFGTGDAGAATWSLLKWPFLLCLVALLVLVLFRSGPPVSRAMYHGAPGGVLAVLLWLVASAGFALYASHFAAYSRLYGSLAGVVVFLIWLWFSNLALLTGAQFNAELTRVASPAGEPDAGRNGGDEPISDAPCIPSVPPAQSTRHTEHTRRAQE